MFLFLIVVFLTLTYTFNSVSPIPPLFENYSDGNTNVLYLAP